MHSKALKKHLKTLEGHIAGIRNKTPEWKEQHSLIRNIPGASNIWSMNLLSSLTELRTLSHREIAHSWESLS